MVSVCFLVLAALLRTDEEVTILNPAQVKSLLLLVFLFFITLSNSF